MKREFHSSKPLKGDPATLTAVSAAANVSSLNVTLIILIGLCSCIVRIWFLPELPADIDQIEQLRPDDLTPPIGIQIPVNIHLGLESIRLYLSILGNWYLTSSAGLDSLSGDQLRQLLFELKGVISLHEYTYDNITNYLAALDQFAGGNYLFLQLDDLRQDWRVMGDSIITLFRQIESLLHIPVQDSSLNEII